MNEIHKPLQLDTTDPADQEILDGVALEDVVSKHKREIARDRAEGKSIQNKIATAMGIAAIGIPAVLFGVNTALKNNESSQKQVSDIPGQQYLQEGLDNGTIDPSQAIHLKSNH